MEDSERQAEVESAVSDMVQRIDAGAFVTGFALVIEVMDAEGERGLWRWAPKGQKCWDTLGYLQCALQMEQAHEMVGQLREDGDG